MNGDYKHIDTVRDLIVELLNRDPDAKVACAGQPVVVLAQDDGEVNIVGSPYEDAPQ